jgi:hypothetical protein
LMELAQSSFQEVTGISLEMMGLTDRNQPGVIESSRKQSGINTLSWAFDSLRRYRKEQGKLLAKFIVKYIADGRLVRITGERRQEFVPLLKNKLTLEFDVVIDESPSAPNVKERTWDALEKILPVAMQMQLPVPPTFVEYAPIPAKLAQEWKETIMGPEKTPEQQQAEQEQAELQKRREQLMDRLLAAEVDKTETSNRETAADVELKKAKTMTENAEREGISAPVQLQAATSASDQLQQQITNAQKDQELQQQQQQLNQQGQAPGGNTA